ncbi:MAG: PAS domain S-box protein [Deltaproteobacteria bacterium]|nr:PAS domain S-box protein [Deltaproteobacteria bacterium]
MIWFVRLRIERTCYGGMNDDEGKARMGNAADQNGKNMNPQAEGERLVSCLRLVLSGVGFVFFFIYLAHTAPRSWPSLYAIAGIFAVWAAFSGVYLCLFARGYYRAWMSYFSITVDILNVTAIQIAYMFTIPLNFLSSPITTFYFVIVGLAGLRKNRTLVLYSGIGSAIAHLTLSAVAVSLFFPSGYAVVDVNGFPLEISFVDEFVYALTIVIVAGAFSYVTKQLIKSEHHYHDLFEHVPDGILIASSSQMILAVNKRFANMVRLSPDSLIGRQLPDFLSIADSPAISMRSNRVVSDSRDASGILLRADGSEMPVRTVAVPMTYEGEKCIEMSVRDVTENVQLEQQLAQSQKMETLGRLAGGLAHDFNNILGGILGATSLAERNVSRIEQPDLRGKLTKQVSVVRECGERARDVVSRLMSFSRSRALETSPIDLNRVISDVATIAGNTMGDDIELTIESSHKRAIVDGDLTSLTQALLNLCINARDAMRDGGHLYIRLKEAKLPREQGSLLENADPSTRYWYVEVEDTGAGIERRDLDKIFEPFYTTKPVGEGTGLGLPMVYNSISEHSGFVDVESKIGQGSTFRIVLPKNPGGASKAK